MAGDVAPMAARRISQPQTPPEPATPGQFLGATAIGLGSIILTLALVAALVGGAMLAAFGPQAPIVTVPDVVGMASDEAEARLEAARLKMEIVTYEYSKNVKEDRIISTHPYAGKVVRAGREVRVSVSRGSRLAKVPQLKGLTLEEATQKLNDADLQVGEEVRQASSEPADLVLGQDPPLATMLKRKSKVNLTLSGGRDFGVYELGDRTFVFRRLKVVVPQGKVLQMVSVDVEGEGMEKSFLERLCRPGEVVTADLYGPKGARVRVRLEDERVFSERL